MEYHSAIKRKKLLTHAISSINLKTLLKEIWKTPYWMIPFTRSVQRKVYTHRKQIKGFLKLVVGTKMNCKWAWRILTVAIKLFQNWCLFHLWWRFHHLVKLQKKITELYIWNGWIICKIYLNKGVLLFLKIHVLLFLVPWRIKWLKCSNFHHFYWTTVLILILVGNHSIN